MTTIAAIRQTYLNNYLGRADGSTLPWSDTQCDEYITDAIVSLWPEWAKATSGTVATNQQSPIYTIPSALTGGRVSRIVAEYVSGGYTQQVEKVTSWRYHSATQVVIQPLYVTDAGLSLRFYGWVPFASTASDLPVNMERKVAKRAASLAFGALSGQLVNSQRQQGLDNGRVVDYPTAVGLSAYWSRRAEDELRADPSMVSYAPRRASRV